MSSMPGNRQATAEAQQEIRLLEVTGNLDRATNTLRRKV